MVMEIDNELVLALKNRKVKNTTDEDLESHRSDVVRYLQQISCTEKPLGMVAREHSYSRSWRSEFEGTLCKPSKLLFLKESWKKCSEDRYDSGDEIDVIDDEPKEDKLNPFCGVGKEAMKGLERSLLDVKCSESEDWEESVRKDGWTSMQLKVFDKATKILHLDQLARLSSSGSPNEPVMVRNQVSTSSKRFRQLFSSFNWETTLAHWLHQTLVKSLNRKYFVSYLEILQTLRFKIPPLIDSMLASTPALEPLPKLCERPWDPVAPLLAMNRPSKLPNNPLFVLFTGVPTTIRLPPIKRAGAWINLFNQSGKVVPINVHSVSHPGMMEVPESMQAVIMTGRSKVRELKAHCTNRPIILLGTNTGSLLALQVASTETVAAVICLGYPSQSVEGGRGLVGDRAVEFKAPTLFVTGTLAQNSHPDVIDEMRDRLKVETGHLIVGGADEWLRMSKDKRKIEGVTQSMVDRAIFEEICSFLLNSLFSDITPSCSSTSTSFAHPSSPSKVLLKSAANRQRLEPPKAPPGSVSYMQYTSATSATFTYTSKQTMPSVAGSVKKALKVDDVSPLPSPSLPKPDGLIMSAEQVDITAETSVPQEGKYFGKTKRARPMKLGTYKKKFKYFPDSRERHSVERSLTSQGGAEGYASPTPSVSKALIGSMVQAMGPVPPGTELASPLALQALQARYLSKDDRTTAPPSPVSPEKLNIKHHRKSPIVHRHGVGNNSPPPLFTKSLIASPPSLGPSLVDHIMKKSRQEEALKRDSDSPLVWSSSSSP